MIRFITCVGSILGGNARGVIRTKRANIVMKQHTFLVPTDEFDEDDDPVLGCLDDGDY